MLGELPDLPHLPELPARGAGADMIGRGRGVPRRPAGRPAAVRLAAGRPARAGTSAAPLDFLARDLDALEELAQGYAGPLKVQVAGPWTLAATVELHHGDKAVSDPGATRDLAQSLAEGVRRHVADVRRAAAGRPDRAAARRAVAAGGAGRRRADGERLRHAARRSRSRWSAAGSPRCWRRRPARARCSVVHCCAPRPPVGAVPARPGPAAVSFDTGCCRRPRTTRSAPRSRPASGLWLGAVPAGPPTTRPCSATSATRSGPYGGLWSRLGFAPELLPGAVVLTPACGLAGASPAVRPGRAPPRPRSGPRASSTTPRADPAPRALAERAVRCRAKWLGGGVGAKCRGRRIRCRGERDRGGPAGGACRRPAAGRDAGGPGAAAELARTIDDAQYRYYVLDRPTLVRRRLRHADARAAGARGRVPRAAHARLADPARRRDLLDPVHPGRPPRADAQPGQRVHRRGAGGLGPAGRARRRRRRRLPLRAQGRRAGRRPGLREGPAGPRRHPRRRPHRRGRHPQPPHPRRRARPAGRRATCPSCSRSAARSTSRSPASRSSTSRWSRRGQGAVRQPAQRRRRLAAAEGPAGDRDPPAAAGAARRRRAQGHGTRPAERVVRAAARLGSAGLRPVPGGARRSPRCRTTSTTTASTGTTSSTRSTASWSRSTSSPCSAGSGRPRGRRAGRSRASTRRRRSTPRCSTSRSTSAAPAASRRTRLLEPVRRRRLDRRPGHPAQRGRGAPQGRLIGDTVVLRKAGDVIPEIVGAGRRAPARRRARVRDADAVPGVRDGAAPGEGERRRHPLPQRAVLSRRSCGSGCSTSPAGARSTSRRSATRRRSR